MMLLWFAACVAAGTPGALGRRGAGIRPSPRNWGGRRGSRGKAPQHAGINVTGSGAAKATAAPDRVGDCSEAACRLDGAEQAVGFVVDAGREQQGGRVASDAVAQAQRPQALVDRAAVLMPQAAGNTPITKIVGVDKPSPKLPTSSSS